MSIQVPKGHHLFLFLLTKSMEGLSLVRKRPIDYFVIDNEVEQYGFSSQPALVYSGNDRERIQIKFKSDLYTLLDLQYPKGFLLYFEGFFFKFKLSFLIKIE